MLQGSRKLTQGWSVEGIVVRLVGQCLHVYRGEHAQLMDGFCFALLIGKQRAIVPARTSIEGAATRAHPHSHSRTHAHRHTQTLTGSLSYTPARPGMIRCSHESSLELPLRAWRRSCRTVCDCTTTQASTQGTLPIHIKAALAHPYRITNR